MSKLQDMNFFRLPVFCNTIRSKVFTLLGTMAITLILGAALGAKIVEALYTSSDKRVLASEIVVITKQLLLQTYELSHLKDPTKTQTLLHQLDQSHTLLERSFRELRGGVAWSGSPPISDPLLLEALDKSEQIWREKVIPRLENVQLESADTANLIKLQRALTAFAGSIDITSDHMEHRLAWKMTEFGSFKWGIFFLNLFVLVLAASILTNTQKRIRKMADVIAKIRNGAVETRAVIEGTDEIADFATAFNEMTAKLVEAKSTSDRILASLGEMLLVISDAGIILSANNATLFVSGNSPEDMIGHAFDEFCANPGTFTEIRSQVETSAPFSSDNIKLRRESGGYFNAAVTATALPAVSGSIPWGQQQFRLFLLQTEFLQLQLLSSSIKKEPLLHPC